MEFGNIHGINFYSFDLQPEEYLTSHLGTLRNNNQNNNQNNLINQISLEEFIIQRNELLTNQNLQNNELLSNKNKKESFYGSLFREIQNDFTKITEITEIPEQFKNFNELIEEYKKITCETYISLNESKEKLNVNKEKYSLFLEQINKVLCILKSIEKISNSSESLEPSEDDLLFKKILMSKLKDYSKLLNLEELQQQVERLESEFKSLTNILKSVNSIQVACMCPLCLDNKVEYFLFPCGHTVCGKCNNKNKLNNNNNNQLNNQLSNQLNNNIKKLCFYCRTEIQSIKTLYLQDF